MSEKPKTQDEIIQDLTTEIKTSSPFFLTKNQKKFIDTQRNIYLRSIDKESHRLVEQYKGKNVDLDKKIEPKLKEMTIRFMKSELQFYKEVKENPRLLEDEIKIINPND